MSTRLKIAIVSILALAACSKKDTGPRVDPALSTLVPADTTLLIGVRVEDLMKTQVYQKYLANRTIGPIEEFARRTGLDPRKDLWEVLLISNGQEQVVLGRGKFSNEAEPRLEWERAGAKRTNYRGFTMIGDDETSVLLLGPTLAGVGDTAGLKRIVDTRDKTNGPPAVLAERMKEILPAAMVWSVFAGVPIKLPPNPSANLGNLYKVLASLESGSLYFDLQSGISGKASGITPAERNGKELYDTLRGVVGLARVMTDKGDPSMQRVLDGLRITQDGRIVNLYIEEPEEAVTILFDFFLSGASGRARPGLPAPKR